MILMLLFRLIPTVSTNLHKKIEEKPTGTFSHGKENFWNKSFLIIVQLTMSRSISKLIFFSFILNLTL